MDDQIGRWKIAGGRKARTDGVLIHDQLVVIPAKAGVDGPLAEMNQILEKARLFEIGTIAGEGKAWWSAGSKGIIGIVGAGNDDVAEMFVKKNIVGLKAGLPFVAAVMDGNSGFNVSLFEIVAQEG